MSAAVIPIRTTLSAEAADAEIVNSPASARPRTLIRQMDFLSMRVPWEHERISHVAWSISDRTLNIKEHAN
jgi:hypothetical protein